MSDHSALAAGAAREWGLPEPILVRVGMNSLFVAGDDVILRVGRPAFPVDTERAWASLMSSLDIRLPRWLHDMKADDGRLVVALERIHPDGEVDWPEVGAMIARLHAVDLPSAGVLPFCGDFPHWQIDALLHEVGDSIDARAMAGIDACIARWSGWRGRAFEERVVCHGDVHPGNVLPTATGPVLLDWDLRCLGPAGWDHGPLMTWSERWGGAPGMYEAFAEGYGRSLRGEWMAEAMAELRLLVATLLRLRAGPTNPAAAAEAERRLCWWRGDDDAPVWVPQ